MATTESLGNATVTEIPYGCDNPRFDYGSMVLYSLNPAIVITVIFAFVKRRKKLWPKFLNGRPGVAYPVNMVDCQVDRYGYACAFGVSATCILDLFTNTLYWNPDLSNIPDSMQGTANTTLTYFNVLIVSTVFYPFFVAIASPNRLIGSVFGLIYGNYWSWYYFYVFAECPANSVSGIVNFIYTFPQLTCLTCLLIGYLYTFCKELWLEYKIRTKVADEEELIKEDVQLRDIVPTYNYTYVKNLLSKPEPAESKPEKKCEKLRSFLYESIPGFRYSTRMISTVLLCFILLYQVSFLYTSYFNELFYGYYTYFEEEEETLLSVFESLNFTNGYYAIKRVTETTYWSFRISGLVSLLGHTFILIFMLVSYREHMLKLYKGDRSFATEKSIENYSLIVSCFRFTGYQIGYILWGFLGLQIVLWIIFVAAMELVIYPLINWNWDSLVLSLVEYYWMAAVFSLVVYVAQVLAAKYAFLREKGGVLALNNRRIFHTVNYTLLYYNVIVGLFSCLLRILKAMFFGVLYLGRSDRCVMLRGWETIDTGYKAYLGFIYLEEAHTHPVMVTFCDLLKFSILEKGKQKSQGKSGSEIELVRTKNSKRYRNRWFKAVTLIRNRNYFAPIRNMPYSDVYHRDGTAKKKQNSQGELQVISQGIDAVETVILHT